MNGLAARLLLGSYRAVPEPIVRFLAFSIIGFAITTSFIFLYSRSCANRIWTKWRHVRS